MASFERTLNGAYKGKKEDIANMKRRLTALLDDPEIAEDLERLKELFGDELEEIDDWDEDEPSETFGGLYSVDWSSMDVDGLYFETYEKSDDSVRDFCSTLCQIFPRVMFDFIHTCYISWGGYVVYYNDELEIAEYEWDESGGGGEITNACVDWKLAKRAIWLADNAPSAELAKLKKAELKARKEFYALEEMYGFDEDGDYYVDNEVDALDMVENNIACAFFKIPEEYRTKEVCLTVIKSLGSACAEIPKKLQTEEFFLEVVEANENGRALMFIPEKFRTVKVCAAAVSKHSEALDYVPENLDGASEVYLAAVQKSGSDLQRVPEKHKTEGPKAIEICLAAVQQSGTALKCVPEKLKTEGPKAMEICLAAVRQDGWALRFVPEKLKTEGPTALEICLAAVQERGSALQYVPEKLKTEKVCLAAVQQNDGVLKYVPEELKSKVEKALKKPAAKIPAEKKPAAEKPAAKKPAAEKPAAKKPAVKKPAAEKPTAKKPAVKKPAAEKPAAKKPAAKLVAKKPSPKKPAANKPKGFISPALREAVERYEAKQKKESASKKPAAKKPAAKEPAKKPAAKKTSSSLEGKSFCFTGELKSMKRKEAEEKVTALGGSAKSTVVKGLDYLVTNDPLSGSSKNKKAAELGVKIIDEKAFLKLVGK